MEPDVLLKEATVYKKNGNQNDAIEKLRQAYQLMENNGIQYSLDSYLRLPMYLQEADKNDEAWSEFNLLIQKLPNIYSTSKEILVMGYSQIYDKMRLFLQSEDKNIEAIKCGILSYLYWGVGLKLQKRDDEYYDFIKKENYIKDLLKLLKKAKIEALLNDFLELIQSQIEKIPKIDINGISRKFELIINK